MRNKSIVLTLAMTLIIGAGATAYAASNSPSMNTVNNRTCSSMGTGTGTGMGMGMGRISNFSGHDILSNLLKSKGVTESEITTALNSGKSMYDILKEKGVTDADIQNYMLSEKTKGIDKAVSEGSITKDQGDEMKSNIKENSTNCTPGQGNGQGRGGMRTR